MADGFLTALLPDHQVYSAGVETHGINPYAAIAMDEKGINIDSNTSNNVVEYDGIDFDYVITVCDHAKETCPVVFTSGEMIHRSFLDPADAIGTEEEKLVVYRSSRDEIEVFCKEFASQLNG